jgi:hypothetical protein
MAAMGAVAVILQALATSPAGRAQPEDAAVDRLAADFEQLVFQDVSFGVARSVPLTRLPTPIYVNITPSSAFAEGGQTALIAKAVAELRELAGVEIETTNDPVMDAVKAGRAKSGFMFDFVEEDHLPPIFANLEQRGMPAAQIDALTLALRNGGCPGIPLGHPQNGYRTTIFLILASTQADKVAYCIRRELVAALGAGGALPRTGTIFSSIARQAGYAEHDLVLVRMLYDPRLRPGMTAAEARPLLPAIAKDAAAP